MEWKSLIPWRHKTAVSIPEQREIFDQCHREMENVFDSILKRDSLFPGMNHLFGERDAMSMPKVNVSDSDREIVVSAELPGVDEKNLDVQVTERSLIIKGERKEENEISNGDRHYRESSYGSFYRSIPLHAEVDSEHVSAEFSKGLLTILLPKIAPSPTRKKIPISTG